MAFFRYGLATSLFAALYSSIWVWQGFDVTDEGVNLTWHWLASINSHAAQYDFMWLTNILAGKWLQLTAEIGILGARLGWVLIVAMTNLACFYAIAANIGPKNAAIAMSFTTLALLHWMTLLIDYNTLPSFILLLALACLLNCYRKDKQVLLYLGHFISGALIGIAIHCRFPMILATSIFVILPFLNFTLTPKETLKNTLGYVTLSAVGITSSFLLGLFYLSRANRLSEYVAFTRSNLNPPEGDLHSIGTIFTRTLETIVSGLVSGVIFVGLGCALALCLSRSPSKLQILFRPLFLLAIIFLVYFIIGGIRGPSFGYEFSKLLFGTSIILSLLLALISVSNRSVKLNTDDIRLLTAAFFSVFFVFAGSNIGAEKSNYALWLFLPFVCFRILNCLDQINGSATRKNIRAFFICGLIALAVTGVAIRYSNPFRDLEDRTLLTAEINTPLTKRIFTSPGRANCVVEIYQQITSLVEPGTKLLSTSNFPMIHYLTRTIPYFDNPKPKDLRLEQIKSRLKSIKDSGIFPKYIVRGIVNLGNLRWGHASAPTVLDNYPPVRAINNFIMSNSYKVIWSNKCFEILKKDEPKI